MPTLKGKPLIPIREVKSYMTRSQLKLFLRIAEEDPPMFADADYFWLKDQKLIDFWRMERPPVYLTRRGEKLKSLLEEGI